MRVDADEDRASRPLGECCYRAGNPIHQFIRA